MSDIVIKVENLGKIYRLGQVGTGTVSNDLNRWWHKIRGKEDPYLRIGETNDRSSKGFGQLVWALKDINFEVNKGEVLGIIGRNGAGKSTLLKILSQVTSPTVGDIKIRGRVASLLEVGTGFHPELSGRENIFLNGAILGMTKKEIRAKFDEIVDFSGVERYIDTPVKRYSSGMYVRLAFAVAAHLEPEILIVDEVLAVGDAEFQKKCIGKMKDVSGQGRTVLFVSHSMPAIRLLCDQCLFMDKGTLIRKGPTDTIINEYMSGHSRKVVDVETIPEESHTRGTGELTFMSAHIENTLGQRVQELDFLEYFSIELNIKVIKDVENISFSVFIVNQFGERVMMSTQNDSYKPINMDKGDYNVKINFKEKLMPGSYAIGLAASFYNTGNNIDFIESYYPFIVSKESKQKNLEYPWDTIHGYLKPETEWKIKKQEYAD